MHGNNIEGSGDLRRGGQRYDSSSSCWPVVMVVVIDMHGITYCTATRFSYIGKEASLGGISTPGVFYFSQ